MDDKWKTAAWAALDQAKENGYDMQGLPAEKVATDICTCEPSFEAFKLEDFDDLVAAVREWQGKKNGR